MKAYTVGRPYTLTFTTSRAEFPLTSEEASELLRTSAIVSATPDRVLLAGAQGPVIQPATRGGGPAFFLVEGN